MRARAALPCAAGLFLAYLVWSCRPFFGFAAAHPGGFGLWTLRHLLLHLAEPAAVAAVFVAAGGVGERLFGALLLKPLKEERPLFAVALGLGVLALAIVACGLAGWNRATTLVFWTAVAAAAATTVWRRRPDGRWGRLSTVEFVSAALVVAALILSWIQASAPPTSWDALAYHLLIPKRWAALGRVGFDVSLYDAKNPLLAQALYLPAFGLGRDTLAQMLHLGFAALDLWAIWLFARRRLSARAGWLAAAVFACQPLFSQFAGTGNTDFIVCFFAFLAVWAFEFWWRGEDARLLALSGALAGLACGTKIIGLWLAAAMTAVLLARLGWRRRGSIKELAVWSIAGLAGGAPWYLLTWRWLGNPVWPYFSRVFGGSPAEQALYERLKASVTEGVAPTLGHLLAMPYILIARPEPFWYGPQFIALPLVLAAAWAAARRRRPPAAVTAVCALYALVWFFVYQGWRYVVPVMPWASLAVGACLDEALASGRLARLAAAAVIVWLGGEMLARQDVSNELFALSAVRPTTPGQTSRDRYLSLSLDHYDLFQWCNANLPAGAKVALFGEMRPYYLERDAFFVDPLNDFRLDYAALPGSDALAARLRELGAGYVIVRPDPGTYQGDQAYYRRADALMRGFLARAPMVKSANGLALYAVPAQ